ncbi:MAG: hypothetical protein BGP05_15200 [Rhizobiales bacterium 62-47]|nr:MAG: hypothetical protein BGP05_15200 [Rhizobiales bacterium 62-47]
MRRMRSTRSLGCSCFGSGTGLSAVLRRSSGERKPPSHLDDFRFAYLFGQVAGPGAVHLDAQQFARVRPLNE